MKIVKDKSKQMYQSMVQYNKKRNHPPKFNYDQFYEWLIQQNRFDTIIQNWKDSNFNSYLAPSVDRIDNNIGYEFTNIKLVTWVENLNFGFKDRAKKILVFDMSGNFINEFQNKHQASFITNDSIRAITTNCSYNGLTKNGFQYKYKNSDKIINKFDELTYTFPTTIYCLDNNCNIVKEYSSIGNALKDLNFTLKKTNKLSSLLNSLYKFKGFYWCEVNKYDEFKKLFQENIDNKKVLQYSREGVLLKEWGSTVGVKNELGLSVATACRKYNTLCGGFQWKYKNSDKEIKPYEEYVQDTKVVYQYSKDSKYLGSFSSAQEAADVVNGKVKNIRKVLYGEKFSYYGFKWSYFKE